MAVGDEQRTASGAGLMRALEQRAERPLFDDPLAGRLLGGWQAVMVGNRVLRWAFLRFMERIGPGFYGAVVCRTRVIDDACRDALAGGIRQVVIVGAGMDTRAYRMPEMSRARVWELDLTVVQAGKRAALARVLPEPPGHVRYAPFDLATQPVGEVLATAGGDLGAPTLVLCEAVLMYLPAGAFDGLLAYAGSLAPGSRLVLTYLPRGVHDDPRHAGWARRLSWQAAFDAPEMAARLAGCGLRVRADLGAEEHRELLLRPLGRSLDVFAGERVVIADA
ncbi:methyltransferase (TIGR00027 family) [Catenuloplanes nepalensis]|uniref:S-adenosyl-L-methionine-dependent methyltransferase n=1 Tax=Catenuloplanes nepalensis TaxID=587533 RepID=A0ABT9MU06_9ACTN|nr:SAM-dependent methyltransferase [Catenuloplanes nepalensis]MDP9794922.1 methyltransferase (TIGR00027 family) [Catenuloplanes nepalensis]